MKLNNSGWGIREMFLLSGILIFFFGLAIYFIYVFYSSLDFSENTKEDNVYEIYNTYEEMLYDAGLDYIDILDNNYEDRIINMSTLIDDGYISRIYDPDTEKVCNGYIKLIDISEKNIKAYISCDNYETEGY